MTAAGRLNLTERFGGASGSQADNQMTALSTGSGTINPTWDLNGNLSNDGTSAYTWDVRNRLLSVGSLASFAYDAAGRRLSLTPGGGSAQYYLYDRLNPAAVLTASGGVLGQFLTGLNLDERFSAAASGITESYLVDALGSTIALVNAAGTTLPTTYSYAPFGTTHTAGTASANPFQFTGRENDPTSLYYLRARYYNPVWGRFISEDPIGLSGGINLYAYGGNDPLNLADPGGLLGLVVSIGAQGEAGSLLFGQAGGQVSQNIAFLIDTSRWSWSHPLNIGFSVVSYQSYGGTASLGLPSVPQGPASNPLSGIANSGGGVIAGGFTGGGVSLGITNADTAADLAPPSATSSVNIGLLGTEFGGQISKTATGIWTATAAIPGLSVGAGVAASVYQTQSGVQTLSTASPK